MLSSRTPDFRKTVTLMRGLALLGVAGCVMPKDLDESALDTGIDTQSNAPMALDPALAMPLAAGQPVLALLHVDDSKIDAEISRKRTSADRAGDRPELIAERAEAWARQADTLIDELPDGANFEQVYSHIPIVVVSLETEEAAQALLHHRDILSIDPNIAHTAFTDNLNLIGQPTAAGNGYLGTGTAVAVLDTGADWTVADLGSCTAVGTPSTCRVAYAADFAPNDGVRDDSAAHGTNVSSIVGMVAPGADIIALDVFNGASASSTDIISAIDWVVANQATYNIAAINMSLGSGGYTTTCNTAFSAAIASARAAGVVVVVSSGNNAYTNAIAAPACDSGALSVGAVYDANYGGIGYGNCTDMTTSADKVTCFSNSASILDILAPGSFIVAGGVTMSGTSQASPHVAGAVAVLRATDAAASVSDLETRLTSNGTTVTDSRNGLSFPRLDLNASVADCISSLSATSFSADTTGDTDTLSITADGSCSWTASSDASWLTLNVASGTGSDSLTWTADANTGGSRVGHISLSGRTISVTQSANSGPTGSVLIASGDTGTRTAAVTLTLSASDTDGVSYMCISNSASCTTWEAYTTTKAWSLTAGTGSKTVYATFADSYGNLSSTVTDTIVVDTTVPSNGTVSASGSDAAAAVSWLGFSDAGAGISSYKVVYGTAAPAASCTSGTVGYTGSSTSTSLTGLTNGSTYTVRVCAIDGAGNTSTGSTTTVRPAPEYNVPTGTISLNGGATWTNSRTVSATLSATDDTAVSTMCTAASTTCTTFVAYSTAASITLGTTVGTQTGYATFKDVYGNTATAVTDTIIYDPTAPTNGTVTASPSSNQVALTWTGYADATSGLASYKVVYAATTAPASCSAGTVGYTGTSTSATITGLVNGTTYGFRVCAIDNAGNTSTGTSTTSRPAPEYNAPTGTISLNGGATWTNSRTVTATLSATDDTAVSTMCTAASTTCSTFVAYATSSVITLGTTVGAQTGYATFKDVYGNTAAAVTDTIIYDPTAPTNGTVTGSASTGQVALTWTGFSDATSGVASYKVVYAATTAPTSCSTGTVGYTGTSTSATVTGLSDGTTYGFRVCAIDNAGNTSTGASTTSRPAPEYNAPTGTIVLNGGASWTNSRTVTATLSATDDTAVSTMCTAASTTCTSFVAYATSSVITLGTTVGAQTGYATFRDSYGNTAAAVTDTIIYDPTAPTNGTVTGTGSSGQVALTWTGFSDATSGVASYKVVYAATTAPTSCSTGTVGYTGTSTSATITGLNNGTTYGFRVCAIDNAGNTGTGASTTSRPAPEYNVPTGTIVLNGGATWTNNRTVTATLSATDDTAVGTMCTAASTTCTTFVAYATSASITLGTTAGSQTGYATFRDSYGNTAAAVTDTIIYDATVPTNGTVTATGAVGQVDLTWTGYSDATSGIASYKVVYAATTAPANCSSGTVGYTGTATSASVTGLVGGTTYGFRVCAIDNAGNTGTGTTKTAAAQ